MGLRKDFGHSGWFGSFMDKSEDWYFDLNGGGEEFEGGMHFAFGFYSGYAVVERFDVEYFEDKVVFGNIYFEDVAEYGRMWKNTEGFV